MAHDRIRGIPQKPKEGRKTLFRLLSYLSADKKLLTMATILVIINIIMGLLGSYMLRPIINDFIIPGDTQGLFKILSALLCIYLIGVVATNVEYRLMNVIGQKTALRIRVELFTKMQYLPVSYFDSKQYGDLMSLYTNDMDRVSDALTDNLADFITAALTLLGILFFMLYISPLLTMVAILMIPLTVYAPSFIVKRSKIYFKAQQNALGELNGYVEEKISGQRVVKVFAAEQHVQEQFQTLNSTLRTKSLKAQFFSGIMMPVMQSLTMLNFVVVTVVGAVLVMYRGLDVGGLATFVQYTRQWGFPINQLATLYNNLQSAMAGAERIFAAIDETAEQPDMPQAHEVKEGSGNIQFRNVSFGYTPHQQVLKEVSVSVKKGQKVAIVGKTGAGKTTFLNMLPRFYDIRSGDILLENTSLYHYRRQSVRKSEAVVLQDTHLFSGSVLENIRYGRLDATVEEVVEAAKLTSAHNFIKRLPQGYDTILHHDDTNLSRGQRQLLSITRAAIANPDILLLDEATGNIDSRSEILIQKGLDKLMRQRTCFIIAHRISTIKNADKILVIRQGSIIEEGTHEELMALQGEYFSLYENQFQE